MFNPFAFLVGLMKKAFGRAQKFGLTDETVKVALGWVEQAANMFGTGTERREFVVARLRDKGIPESIARLAVEVAVQAWKAKAGK
jgi:hypothetical protein